MAIYEYYCSACDVVHELIQSIAKERMDFIPCPFCDKSAEFQFSKVAVLTGGVAGRNNSGFLDPVVDIAIGKNSQERWEKINERQEKRDKLRKETGQVGLAATSENDYQPISREKKELRSKVTEQVVKDGFKPQYSPSDSKLV